METLATLKVLVIVYAILIAALFIMHVNFRVKVHERIEKLAVEIKLDFTHNVNQRARLDALEEAIDGMPNGIDNRLKYMRASINHTAESCAARLDALEAEVKSPLIDYLQRRGARSIGARLTYVEVKEILALLGIKDPA